MDLSLQIDASACSPAVAGYPSLKEAFVAGIDRVTSASNVPGNSSIPSDPAAELIHEATDPRTGAVDTRRLAAALSQMGNFHQASQGYAQIEAELSQRSPITAAQFSRDVVDYFATGNSGAVAGSTPSPVDAGNQATPQGLRQLLEQSGIRVSPNVSNTAAPATASATAVDYGNIPEEHQWRYDRYLEGAANKPKVLGPNDWYAAAQRAWANNKSGNTFEQQVRTELGAPLGKGSKPVTIGNRVPDLPVGDDYGVTDIKNVAYLHDTDQLKQFAQYAKDNKLPFNLIVGPDTQGISGPLLDNVRATGGTVTQYDPATKQFSTIEIGESGNWKRPAVASTPANTEQDVRATGIPPEEGAKVPTLNSESTAAPGVKAPALNPESTSTPGVKAPLLEPESSMSGVKAGSLWGGAAGATVSLVQLAATGKLDPQNLGQVAKGAGESAVISAVATKGEQLVAPVIDKVVGSAATKVATTAVSEEAGVVAGQVVSRVAGATVVGAVITTGVSAWENRAGLMQGDSKAIGNVVADTAVGAGSIAAATVAGAAIGSVVPVAGTAVGAVAGLAVGLAVTYGAQISGVRNAIADGAAHAVDGIKSAAGGVADAAKSVASGVSHAASSVANFFGF